jgi:hypothetical protein
MKSSSFPKDILMPKALSSISPPHVVMPSARNYEHPLFARVVQKKNPGQSRPLPRAAMQRLTDVGCACGMDHGIDTRSSVPASCINAPISKRTGRLHRAPEQRPRRRLVAAHPDRLVGIGQSPERAIRRQELERAVRRLGLKGAVFFARMEELGDPGLWFWAKAQELDAAIFIHPAGNTDPRLARHRRLTSFGQQIEEAFALSSLVYDGVLDEFPNLKIAFAHGGGFLPYYYGRLDFFHRKGYSPQLKGDFSSYLGRLHYDTVVFDPRMIELAAVPASCILLGTGAFAEPTLGAGARARTADFRSQDASWAPMYTPDIRQARL